MVSFKLKNTQSAKAEQHPFHIVDSAPLPLFVGLATVLLLLHVAVFMTDWGQALRSEHVQMAPSQYDHVSPTSALVLVAVTILIA
jgi:hypothetical protein